MSIQRLVLANYRNIVSATMDFAPGFTVLAGRNGAGKTNILEALYLVSTLRSFRVNTLSPLIHNAHARARVELRAREPGSAITTKLAVVLEQGTKTTRRMASIDDKVQRSAEAFYGRVPAILFTPEDLNVLRGSPAGRRQLLDRALFARNRAHIGDVRAYDKVVRSRNRVLKQRRGGEQVDALLETYDEQVADIGARIWSRRVDLLHALTPEVQLAFAEIHGGGECWVQYHSPAGDGDSHDRRVLLRTKLGAAREIDTLRGATSVGPHHDDFLVHFNGQPVADFASQGQTRAIMLAFKIAELRSARELHHNSPLLLLDDVSSELDRQRSAQLFRLLEREVGQCVVTTTAGDFLPFAHADGRIDFDVDSGQVRALARVVTGS